MVVSFTPVVFEPLLAIQLDIYIQQASVWFIPSASATTSPSSWPWPTWAAPSEPSTSTWTRKKRNFLDIRTLLSHTSDSAMSEVAYK
jgi:hypothetical protein